MVILKSTTNVYELKLAMVVIYGVQVHIQKADWQAHRIHLVKPWKFFPRWDLRPPIVIRCYFGLQYQMWTPSCGGTINSVERLLVLPILAKPALHIGVHLPGMLVFAHTGSIVEQECWWQSPASSLRAPSGTIKASQQAESFQFSPNLIFPWPTVKACTCGIFSNRILLSSLGIQPIAVAIAFMVCEA